MNNPVFPVQVSPGKAAAFAGRNLQKSPGIGRLLPDGIHLLLGIGEFAGPVIPMPEMHPVQIENHREGDREIYRLTGDAEEEIGVPVHVRAVEVEKTGRVDRFFIVFQKNASDSIRADREGGRKVGDDSQVCRIIRISIQTDTGPGSDGSPYRGSQGMNQAVEGITTQVYHHPLISQAMRAAPALQESIHPSQPLRCDHGGEEEPGGVHPQTLPSRVRIIGLLSSG